MELIRRTKRLYWLSILLSLYMVMPFGNIPFVGLSLSAPIAGIMMLELAALSSRLNLRLLEPWLAWAGIFWFCCCFTIVGNILQGRITSFDSNYVMTMVQYLFWLMAFLATALIVSHFRWQSDLCNILGAGIMMVAILRFVEVIIYQNWGTSDTKFLSRNTYGILMSTFYPFAVLACFQVRKKRRWLALTGLLVLLVAIVGNLSRSTWIAVGASLVVMALIMSIMHPRAIRYAWVGMVPLVVMALGFIVIPETTIAPIIERFDSLSKLDQERSYLLRTMLIEKAWMLYHENPQFGVGLGRFSESPVYIEMPRLLGGGLREYSEKKSPHNSYLGFLAETGLAGGIPFGLLLIVLAGVGLWAVRGHTKRQEWWALTVYASFVGMSIHLWSLAGLTGTAPWYIYGFLAGIIQREQLIRAQAADVGIRRAA